MENFWKVGNVVCVPLPASGVTVMFCVDDVEPNGRVTLRGFPMSRNNISLDAQGETVGE